MFILKNSLKSSSDAAARAEELFPQSELKQTLDCDVRWDGGGMRGGIVANKLCVRSIWS